MINISDYLFTVGYLKSFPIFSWYEHCVHAYESISLVCKFLLGQPQSTIILWATE